MDKYCASLSAKDKLIEIRQWARDKIQSGREPPWAWYQYMKLMEAADAILAGMGAITTENSQQSDQPRERHLRLVGATDQQDTVQPHRVETPVQLPM